jgi:hypothetical protein
MDIVCNRCKQSSIPVPPGTPATCTYTCRNCCKEILKSRLRNESRLASLLWLVTPDENTPHEVESYETISGSADDFESEALPSVEIEAGELLVIAKSGSIPFEEIVRLVAVPDETVAALKRFDGLNHTQLFRVVSWRRKVLEKFVSLYSSEGISSAA